MGDGTANGERYLSEASVRAMQTSQVTINNEMEWGIGWSLRNVGGLRVVQHGGGTNGHITQMLCVPSHKVGLVVLTNSSRGSGLIDSVEKWFYKHECDVVEERPATISLPASSIEKVLGKYVRPIGTMTVSADNGGISVVTRYNNPFTQEEMEFPALHAQPLSEWEYLAVEEGGEESRIEFLPNGEGSAARFIRFGGRLAPKVQ